MEGEEDELGGKEFSSEAKETRVEEGRSGIEEKQEWRKGTKGKKEGVKKWTKEELCR